MRIEYPKLKIGENMPYFKLKDVSGKFISSDDLKDKDILVIIFSCNHCPTVQAYEERIIKLQDEFKEKNVQFIAINSNDDKKYPEDSYEKMKERAKEKGYNFYYLRDDSQEVAINFGAICTPHVFVFDKERKLRYQGRIDNNKNPELVNSHDLKDALNAILENKEIKNPITRPFGCSIKWKDTVYLSTK